MLFRRHGQIHERPAVPGTAMLNTQTSPIKLDTTPPTTLEEILNRSRRRSRAPQHNAEVVNKHLPSLPQDTGDGHNYGVPKRTPTSRKTGFATIRTDSTDSQPAFESDAFAVLMPTTRLPILDRTITPPKTSTAAARAEALKTYQEKARQGRERNNSQGVQIPSKLVSYSSNTTTRAVHGVSMEVNASPPCSPRNPAGTFPVSPPLPQVGWAQPAKSQNPTRDVEGRSNICTPRKPITTTKTNTSPSSYYRVYRSGSEAAGSRSMSASPTTIKIRVKPKFIEPAIPTPVQMESGDYLYHRRTPDSSARSLSPSKSMPNFTRHHSVEGDSIFGYEARSTREQPIKANVIIDNNNTTKDKVNHDTKKDDPEKPQTPKRTLASRLPWLRTTTTKPTKPPTTPPPSPPIATPRIPSAEYIDPFTSFTTPISAPKPKSPIPNRRTPSPKKLARPNPNPHPNPPIVPKPSSTTTPSPPSSTSTHKFDTGFAQIKRFLLILIKCGIVIYGVIAAWYILDALRGAVEAICVPFRVLRWVSAWLGVGVLWALRLGVAMWERFGVRVAGKGGLRWWW